MFCVLLLSPLIVYDVNSIPVTRQPAVPVPPPISAPFDNIILMIGDGMSWAQINATRIWLGSSYNLTMDELPHLGDIETYSLNAPVTDSAAAATALATGNRTNNDMLSITPGGKILTTILEAAEGLDKSTGLVTTAVINHATPAAFAAHVDDRSDYEIIAEQELYQDIEVLLGGGMSWFSPYLGTAASLGYHIVENRTEMWASLAEDYLLGIFEIASMNYEYDRDTLIEPHIAEMTNATLQILEQNDNGFFLMVEGARIDHAGHDRNINNTIGETLAFDKAVKVAYEYTQQHPRTLLVVTADHECGGLWVNMSNPVLEYSFAHTSHTDTPVPVFVYYNGTTTIPTFSHLTDIGEFLFQSFGLPPRHLPVEFVNTPTDQLVEYGDPCYYQLDAFTVDPFDSWWINDTTHFTIDSTGLIQNATTLTVGNYGLEVMINDTNGFNKTASFTFHIQDNTPPTWVTLPQNQVIDSGTSFDYQLQATDLSGISQWLINDTIHFTIDGTGHITSTTILSAGHYGLNVTLTDPHGNMLSATFSVTVQETTLPPPPPPAIPGFPLASIAIALLLALTLILSIRRKTRKSL